MCVKTASDVVIEVLANHGVTHVFLLPGGGNMYLVDAVVRNPRITPIPMLHEQSVGIAADAYAQYRNNVGVALVTTGPGATNAITACAAAWADSTPVLFISGQVKQSDDASILGLRQKGFQETPITEIVKKITKASVKLSSAAEVRNVVKELIQTALDGRPGPVWLDMPLNLQSEIIDEYVTDDSFNPKGKSAFDRVRVVEALIDELIEDWKQAERPIILLGNGVRLANAEDVALSLIKKTQTPALLTWKALDFLDDLDPLNAGRPGSIGQRSANFAQQNSDFLISIGARIDSGQSGYRLDHFAPGAKKYVVDIDAKELLKFDSNIWTRIHCDALIFLSELLQRINSLNFIKDSISWINAIDDWAERYPVLQDHHLTPNDGINLYFLMDLLSSSLNATDVIAPGSSGACSEVTMQSFKVKKGQRVLNSEGLGPMGFGIPGAIGSCIASGGRKTYCVDGDGGFLMNVQDLGTVAVQKLPINFFVLNNDGYGSIKVSQDNYFEGRRIGTDPSTGLGLPQLEAISRAFQISYKKLESHEDLVNNIDFIVNSNEPMIVEIMVSSDQKTEPRVTSGIDKNGKIFSYPMEDMIPLLSLQTMQIEMYNSLTLEIIERKRF